MEKLSIFGGTGFIGNRFKELYPDISYVEPRDSNSPVYSDLLYLISTTHNYHVFTDIHKDVDTNLTKLLSVLDGCRKEMLNRDVVINYLSSWFIYGKQDKLPVNEETICNPRGFYSITKYAAEMLLKSYCETFNIKYRIFRLCNAIGKGDKFSNQKNALQYLINEMKENRDIKLYHGGDFTRDYLSVDKVCEAIHFLIQYGNFNQIYNIGSGKAYNFGDLVKYCHSKLNSKSLIKIVNPPDFHKKVQEKDFCMDVSKINKLGFSADENIYSVLDELL